MSLDQCFPTYLSFRFTVSLRFVFKLSSFTDNGILVPSVSHSQQLSGVFDLGGLLSNLVSPSLAWWLSNLVLPVRRLLPEDGEKGGVHLSFSFFLWAKEERREGSQRKVTESYRFGQFSVNRSLSPFTVTVPGRRTGGSSRPPSPLVQTHLCPSTTRVLIINKISTTPKPQSLGIVLYPIVVFISFLQSPVSFYCNNPQGHPQTLFSSRTVWGFMGSLKGF